MPSSMRAVVFCRRAAIYLGATALLLAQGPEKTISIKGEISYEGGGRTDAFSIELLSQGRPVSKAVVLPNGDFELTGVRRDEYELRVLNAQGDELTREFIGTRYDAPVLVRLQKLERAQPVSGTVSLNALLRPVPARARQEFVKAHKALDHGDAAGAVRHLEKSIEICPEYLQAHNDLGVRYANAGDFDRGAAQFRAAADLDPKASLPAVNLALTLIGLQRFDAAAIAAQRALAADSSFIPARYASGMATAAQGQCTRDALEHLKSAFATFPNARLVAARLLVCRGDVPEALSQLHTYLEVPNAPNRPVIERWMTAMQAKLKSAAILP